VPKRHPPTTDNRPLSHGRRNLCHDLAMRSAWQNVVSDLRSRSFPAGIDLVQPFQVAWYNGAVGDAFRLPDFGRSSALGVLLGNTRALWLRFLRWLRASPPRLDEDHPLDRYVREVVLQSLKPLTHRWEVRFAHEAPPRRVAMQRIAHVSGLAYLAPSRLNVHVMFGPWIALRAAVVIDMDGPAGPFSEPPNPCPHCERHCLPKFRRAMAAAGSTSEAREAVVPHLGLWLSVRDACPVGREHRYSEEQIGYHYTKDRERLRRALRPYDPQPRGAGRDVPRE
jgi:cyanocobalamin reductase (cyanide-eliminating) / alkylcobalamin dealkylase